MTDRPIIFSAPMVLALLAGRKTQTRRMFKLPTKGEYVRSDMGGWVATTNGGPGVFRLVKGERIPCPETVGIWNQTTGTCLDAPYQVGDRLYVRENFQFVHLDENTVLCAYAANCLDNRFHYGSDGGVELIQIKKWRPCIHMPRLASRITLTVTGVKVERLQDISEADAQAEGAPWYVGGHGIISDAEYAADPGYQPSKRAGFEHLWNEIHGWGPPAAWAENPWVVAVSFTVEQRNIDTVTT